MLISASEIINMNNLSFNLQNKIWNLPDWSTILPKFRHCKEGNRLGNYNFFGTRPNWVVSYISYTKFHSPRPVFHSPSQIFTRIGERTCASFPAWGKPAGPVLPVKVCSLALILKTANSRHHENFWAFTRKSIDFGLILLISNMIINYTQEFYPSYPSFAVSANRSASCIRVDDKQNLLDLSRHCKNFSCFTGPKIPSGLWD